MASDSLSEAIERLEKELAAVRADLKALLPLVGLTSTERRRVDASTHGQWSAALGGPMENQTKLWDGDGQEWRLIDGGWTYRQDYAPRPLHKVIMGYGPIAWTRPDGAYGTWDD